MAMPTCIFVAGDKSSVGKSTICLSIISALVDSGDYEPSDLAYIKPATQCTDVGLELKYFNDRGIAFKLGPVIFYEGFSRECIRGESDSGEELLAKVREAVTVIGAGKRLVVVDGVGYPSVGSCVGLSNATIAAALGAKVLLVGKHGCGDAIDSVNLNLAFFERHGVRVTGVLFNKIKPGSLDDLRTHVTMFFRKHVPELSVYGHVPIAEALVTENMDKEKSRSCALVTAATTKMEDKDRTMAAAMLSTFLEHVDFAALRKDFLI